MSGTKVDADEVKAQVKALRKSLHVALYDLGEGYDAQIDAILKIANGDVEIPPDERKHWMKLVDSALYSLRAPLLGTMGGETLPDGFWLSELGQAIMHARIVLSGDTLITRAEAARRIYGVASKRNLIRVKRLAEGGRLTPYRDPSADPSRSGLLSEREVQRVIDEGEGAGDNEG